MKDITAGLRLVRSTAVLFILIFMLPSGAAGKVRSEASQGKAPEWTRRVPEADRDYLYFVGRATAGSSLEAAESDAAADALRQMVTTIGVEASFSYDRLRKEADLLLEDRLSISGSSRVIGLKRLESYYEKLTTSEGDRVKTAWNAQLLVRYPRKALEAEQARLEQESAERVQIAGSLLEEALELERKGVWEGAFLKLVKVLELGLTRSVHASAQSGRSLAEIADRAREAARRLSLLLRRITVDPVSVEAHPAAVRNEDTVLTEALEQALLDQGFLPEKLDPALSASVLPRVVAACREEGASSLDEGFCFSRWTVAIRVLDPRDDSVMLSAVYSAKGFGTDLARADQDAQRKLRVEVFSRFAREARDKFDLSFGQGG